MWKWIRQSAPDPMVVFENGVEAEPVATLVERIAGRPGDERGRAHVVVVDFDHYALVLETWWGGRRTGRCAGTSSIFPEALEVLRSLPVLKVASRRRLARSRRTGDRCPKRRSPSSTKREEGTHG